MTINEIFSELKSKVAELVIIQRNINKIYDNELKSVVLRENANTNNEAESINLFYFPSVKDGIQKKYHVYENHFDKQRFFLLANKNRQYQWILASAYEAYEDFLEASYTYLGYIDENAWLMSDYGDIPMNDERRTEYSYLFEQVQKKRNKPHSILNRLRTIFPGYKDAEFKNHFNVNLKFRIIFIEKLRHHIVHTQGKVSDKSEFIKYVFEKTAEFIDKDQMTQFINEFFVDENVSLIERRIHEQIPIEIVDTRLDLLVNNLLSDAYLIVQEIEIKENA